MSTGGAVEQWYNNAASFDTASVITLTSGQDLAGINATLVKGATISGKITAPPGVSLTSVTVQAFRVIVGSSVAGTASVGTDGTYKITGLAAGSYQLQFGGYNTGALEKWYSNVAPFTTPSAITLTSGQDLTGINATLVKAATISGKITVPTGVDPSTVAVVAYKSDSASSIAATALVGLDGTYKITGLTAGSFKLGFTGYGALEQWYNKAASFDTASVITLTSGQDLTGINATLVKAATISGKITAPPGTNLNAMWAMAYKSQSVGPDETSPVGAPVGPDGTYKIIGLAAGSYKLKFFGYNTGALEQWYKNATSYGTATAVTVTTGQDLAGIDATLVKGATISGKITVPAGIDLTTVAVEAYRTDSSAFATGLAYAAADGTYKIIGLPAGSYKVKFAGYDTGLIDQWYGGGTTFESATALTLTTGIDKPAINFTSNIGGSITGTIAGSMRYYPVSVLDAAGNNVKETYVSPGAFSVVGLAAGSYKVAFNRSSGYSMEEAQFYQGKPESAGLGQATPVTVLAGKATGNINAVLALGGTVGGTVLDKTGKPLINATVQAYTLNGSLVTRSSMTDTNGKYSIPGLSTGNYIVKVFSGNAGLGNLYSGNVSNEAQAVPVKVTSGKVSTLNLSYPATAALTAPVPTITGTAKVGSTLTAVPGTWGPAPVTLTYQWKANGVVVGANASTYIPVAADAGKTLTVTVTGTKTGYTTAAKTSAATTAVIALPALSPAPVPTITGTAKVGSTLTAVPGTWGPAPVTLTYQWKANGVVVG
ncbi:carboxypeptidase-like regulatory domain-containing protein, partial [Arthrobacter sp. H-02-3]|uniref:carboxypeptidase-like regulatory domain-containing protein n=1 Tax=Arthrobacter sp. H-02-3 TaxID=2703675 RepID=UPI001379623C